MGWELNKLYTILILHPLFVKTGSIFIINYFRKKFLRQCAHTSLSFPHPYFSQNLESLPPPPGIDRLLRNARRLSGPEGRDSASATDKRRNSCFCLQLVNNASPAGLRCHLMNINNAVHCGKAVCSAHKARLLLLCCSRAPKRCVRSFIVNEHLLVAGSGIKRGYALLVFSRTTFLLLC